MFQNYSKQMLFESCLNRSKGGIGKRASAPSNGSCSERIARRSTDALYADAAQWILQGLTFDVQIVSWTAFLIRRRNGAPIALSRRLIN